MVSNLNQISNEIKIYLPSKVEPITAPVIFFTLNLVGCY